MPIVPIPVWRKKSARKVKAVRTQVRERTGREATIEEIVTGSGLTAKQIQSLDNDKQIIIPIDSNETGAIQDEIISDVNIEAATVNKMGNRMVQYLVMSMPVRERFILQAYYGFITDASMSLKQIASILNISSERVRQIKMEALDNLKKMLGELDIADITDVLDI